MTVKKTVTQKEIAERLKVTTQTVSMAINGSGRLSEEMRQKVLKMASEMNYIPNAAARALVNRKSFLFGAIMPYLSRSFFGNILAGIEEQAQLKNFSVLIGNSEGGPAVEKRALERMLAQNVDGIIALPSAELFDFYRFINNSGTPVVQIMHHIPDMNDLDVVVDNYQGAREATEYLISHDHRRIAMISHGETIETARLRVQAFRDAMEEAGLPNDFYIAIPLSTDAAEMAASELLQKKLPPSAIFCGSDYAALGVIRAARKLNIKVPEELEVIGFDDMDFANMQYSLQLSTVAQPKEEIGRVASRMLVKYLEHKTVRQVVISPQLILRETTR